MDRHMKVYNTIRAVTFIGFFIFTVYCAASVVEFKEIDPDKRYENDMGAWNSVPRLDNEQFMSFGEWIDREHEREVRMDRWISSYASDGKMNYDDPYDSRGYEGVSFDASDRDYK